MRPRLCTRSPLLWLLKKGAKMDTARTFFNFVDHVLNDRVIGNETEKITKITAVIEYIKAQDVSDKVSAVTEKTPR